MNCWLPGQYSTKWCWSNCDWKTWFADADDVDDADVDGEDADAKDADAKDADANDADADANADAEQWARAEGLVARIPVIGGIT